MAPAMDIDIKTDKKKNYKYEDLVEEEKVMDCTDDSHRKEKKKKRKRNEDSALIQLIAKYLDKRNLHKSLSSLLSETQCKSSWKTQAMDLEDIYNQCSIQDSENLKHNVEEGIVEQENNRMSINDQNNNDQSEPAKSKGKKRKAPREDIDPDLEKKPIKTDSVKLEKYLQEPVEVTKEVKKKKKKDLIDNNKNKTSSHKEDRSSMKDNNYEESPEVFKEEDKKKKKNSTDKDLIIDNKMETDTIIGNGNSIKEKSKSSKASRKNKQSGKLDKSFQEGLDVPKKERKKKKNFEDRDLESLEVPKQKRKEEQEAEVEDSGDDTNQNGSKKNQKDSKGCKKKLLLPSSNATSEVATNSNLNGLAEDPEKPLFDITPGQKGVNGDRREGNISLNSKQKSGEATAAKAFQRVKMEEVEFVDPRLQDNSYWAKSGAEIGYGAKAEQVLGQVKGKDFRHEKTKKKRGSYKGGMIDLQSHSIKFSYSDEE